MNKLPRMVTGFKLDQRTGRKRRVKNKARPKNRRKNIRVFAGKVI
jgi:hypothetical protein